MKIYCMMIHVHTIAYDEINVELPTFHIFVAKLSFPALIMWSSLLPWYTLRYKYSLGVKPGR